MDGPVGHSRCQIAIHSRPHSCFQVSRDIQDKINADQRALALPLGASRLNGVPATESRVRQEMYQMRSSCVITWEWNVIVNNYYSPVFAYG